MSAFHLPRRVTRPLVTAVLLITAPAVFAAQWNVIQDESTLGFTATQTGSEFDGTFAFTADMRFDREKLGNSGFDVTVDLTSVDTGSRRRDQTCSARSGACVSSHSPNRSFSSCGRRSRT